MQTIINDEKGAKVRYKKLHSSTEANKICKNILKDVEKLSKPEKGIMYGKEYVSERKTVQIADPGIKPYKYKSAGSTKTYSWKISPTIKKEKELIEKELGIKFNFCLVNIYTPDAYLGYHSDDEKDMVENSTVGSLSFGAERDFLLKPKSRFSGSPEKRSQASKGSEFKKSGDVTKILLENGSLVTMEGSCQQVYKHSIPKRANVSGIRVNLTFRQMLPNAQSPKVNKKKSAATGKEVKVQAKALTVKELKTECKKRGLKKYSALRKQELINLLEIL